MSDLKESLKEEKDISAEMLEKIDSTGKVIIRQNIAPFFITYSVVILGVLFLILLISVALFEFHTKLLNILEIDGVVLFVLLLIFAFTALLSWFEITRKYYVITEGFIVIRRRIIQDDESAYDLKEFYAGSAHQSFLGRILNYGDIYFNNRRIGEKNIILQNVPDPHSVLRVTEEIKRHHG